MSKQESMQTAFANLNLSHEQKMHFRDLIPLLTNESDIKILATTLELKCDEKTCLCAKALGKCIDDIKPEKEKKAELLSRLGENSARLIEMQQQMTKFRDVLHHTDEDLVEQCTQRTYQFLETENQFLREEIERLKKV